jgi:SAM-dependent methyltransferase
MSDRSTTWWLPASGERWADDYERGRPGWPAEAVDIPELSPSATVLELAAGTGKLTRRLIATFRRVIAVEPQPAMRRLLRASVEADVLSGAARQVPVRDRSADAVFVAQAFHLWADEAAVAEIARVLRPGGVFVVMWNAPMGPWEPSTAAADAVLYKRLAMTSVSGYDPLDLDSVCYTSGAWRDAFAGSAFGEMHERRIANPQRLDRDGLVAFLASMGWIADLPEAERQSLLDEARSLLDAAEYQRVWETHVHWGRVPDGSGSTHSRAG